MIEEKLNSLSNKLTRKNLGRGFGAPHNKTPLKKNNNMNYSNLINFFSNFKDNIIIKQIKKQLIKFVFKDRHTPFNKTKKIFLNKKYFIKNFFYDVYDYSHITQLVYSSYEHEHFLFYLNTFKENENFIDIGSNIGMHSFFILKYLRPKKVISVEPQSLCVHLQKKTLEGNIELASEKIEFINSAVGYKERNIKIFRNNTGSGTLVDDFGKEIIDLNNINTLEVTHTSVEDIFKKVTNGITNIKIDTQGAEIMILEEISKSNFIDNINKIIFEINLNEIDRLRNILNKYLNKFKLTDFNSFEVSINELHKHVKKDLVLSNLSLK